MKKLNSILILLFLIIMSTSFAQHLQLSVRVISEEISFNTIPTITLYKDKKTVETKTAFVCLFEKLSSGSYELVVTANGFQTYQQDLMLNQESKQEVIVHLLPNEREISDVIIWSSQKQADSSSIVSKMPLKDLENPQVYQSIPQKMMQDQVATEMSDVLKNATGVSRLWESTGRGGDGAEFYTMRGFSVQPTMINGVPGVNNGVVDPVNIESVDVIKGPSGTLFGSPMIAYGGLINVSTKRPYEKLGGSFGFVTGSFGQNRMTADINVPLDKRTAIRINSAFNDQQSFQDAGFRKSLFFAPSFKFSPSEKVTFIINTAFQTAESANAPMIFLNRYAPLTHHNLDQFEKLYSKSFTSNDLTIKNPTINLQAQALVKISKKWNAQTIISRSQSKNNGYYHYFWDFSDGNTFGRYISKRNGETQTLDLQQNFQGDFLIGKVRNRVLIGLDYFHSTIYNASSNWVSNGSLTILDGHDTGYLSQNGVDSLLSTSFEGVSQVQNEVMSAYVSDVINITSKLSALLSVRLDHFSGATNYWSTDEVKSQLTVSPKFGLVYQPMKDKVSLFTNYMNGFINQTPVQVADIDGQNVRMKTLNPEQANQFEIGLKTAIMKDKISFQASYYSIVVNNKVMSDPTNVNDVIQGGEVTSKGLEMSLLASPIKGMQVVGGISINESIVTKDDPANGYLGLRPEEAGPAQLANLWIQYTLPVTKLKGFGIGLGGNYAGKFATLNRSVTGIFVLPSYTVVNAAISYKTTYYDFILKADNLLNKKYYSGWSTITPQQLRSISLSFIYKF